MFNTDVLSAIVPFVLLLVYRFPFDPARPCYGKTSPRYLNETKSSANYILLDNNVRERVIVARNVNDPSAERYLLFRANFRSNYARVLLRLSTHTERDPCDIIGTYCVYRPVVVIRGIEENRRHESRRRHRHSPRQPTRSRFAFPSCTRTYGTLNTRISRRWIAFIPLRIKYERTYVHTTVATNL